MDEEELIMKDDFQGLFDNQETVHYCLKSISEIKKKSLEQIPRQLSDLIISQIIVYLLILSAIIAFIIFNLMNLNYSIILIDVGIIYLSFLSLKYLENKYYKILKISKRKFYYFMKQKKRTEEYSKFYIIFHLIIIILTSFILISSLIESNIMNLIFLFGFTLIYIYFDKDLETLNDRKD